MYSQSGQRIRTEAEYRSAVFDTAVYYSSRVREIGYNNSPYIVRFNKYSQISLKSPYCSAFGIYCWGRNGIRFPDVTPRAYSWKNPRYKVWDRGWLMINRLLWPKFSKMDAVVMTWSHVEFLADVNVTKTSITNVGANTKGGRKVEGVYHPIKRSLSDVYGIYNHFTPYYNKNIKPINQ